MPWYAQREGLPDTHKMWADPGSEHEAVLQRLRYVEVTAPGAEPADETPAEQPAEVAEQAPPVETAKSRGKAR